jgi:hypothetical protein
LSERCAARSALEPVEPADVKQLAARLIPC